jgi:hypothetical protein
MKQHDQKSQCILYVFFFFFVTILNSSVQIVQTILPDISKNLTRHSLCTDVPHEQGDFSKHGSKQI